MNRFIRIIILMTAVTAAAGGCRQAENAGPEAVVEAFNRAVTCGDWCCAEDLCDTASMREYLESYKEAWETIQRTDSSAAAIAATILSGAVLEFDKVERDGDSRNVYYTLEADGHTKERKAVVKKTEEGEWKVTAITDAI